jgi:uncharacterized nucleotidyltransferase DUF6036
VPPQELKPSSFSPDTLELLRLLGDHQVRYVVVGGQAVIYYGYPRLTGDIDLFFDSNEENAARLFDALAEFWGGDIPGVMKAEELTHDGLILQFGRPPNRIDFMNRVDGLGFTEAWETRIELRISDTAVHVPYLSLPKLIKNKEVSGRPRDLEDLEYLRRAAELGNQSPQGD